VEGICSLGWDSMSGILAAAGSQGEGESSSPHRNVAKSRVGKAGAREPIAAQGGVIFGAGCSTREFPGVNRLKDSSLRSY